MDIIIINNVNEAIIKDALSPVKKIKIKVEKKIKPLTLKQLNK